MDRRAPARCAPSPFARLGRSGWNIPADTVVVGRRCGRGRGPGDLHALARSGRLQPGRFRPGAAVASAARPPARSPRSMAVTCDSTSRCRPARIRSPSWAISMAGTQKATPMARRASDGSWSADVPLAPGRHVYAFVVDGKRWIVDPLAPQAPDDGFGPTNAVVIEGAREVMQPVVSLSLAAQLLGVTAGFLPIADVALPSSRPSPLIRSRRYGSMLRASIRSRRSACSSPGQCGREGAADGSPDQSRARGRGPASQRQDPAGGAGPCGGARAGARRSGRVCAGRRARGWRDRAACRYRC